MKTLATWAVVAVLFSPLVLLGLAVVTTGNPWVFFGSLALGYWYGDLVGLWDRWKGGKKS